MINAILPTLPYPFSKHYLSPLLRLSGVHPPVVACRAVIPRGNNQNQITFTGPEETFSPNGQEEGQGKVG